MEESNVDSSGTTRALSAYQHFSKLNSQKIREALVNDGKESGMGAISTAVSLKWKSMTEAEQQQYHDMAAQDRDRYDAECRVRDAEVLRLQEERRKKNDALGETDSRIRGSTMKQTDHLLAKIHDTEAARKPRVISAEQAEATAARKKAKEDYESSMQVQHDKVAENKAKLAEQRLKFLLQQSDIFAHFGVGKGGAEGATSAAEAAAASSAAAAAPSDRRQSHHRASASDELDEDEKAMVAGEEGGGHGDAPVLTKQPNCIKGEMRAYQLEGLNWMIKLEHNGINGILADEMGLGKTLQSISILGYMREFKKVNGPHLVIVPKSTLSNWGNEFARWCPSARVLKFHGDKDERMEIAQNVLRPELLPHERSWDVCITTYEVCNIERTAIQKIAWRYLVIDEAHRIKNEASQFSTNIRLLRTEHRLLLTGTPLQNNLHELWALLNFLLPDVFGSAEQFDEWFNLDVDDVESKQRMISQLHKILRPFMLRRLKVDVEASLLPKIETILYTGMSAVQKTLYRQILMRDIDVLQTGGANSEGSRTTILNIVMQLRKCCNHPYLFPGIEDRSLDPLGDHLYESCGKMVLLDKLLGRLFTRKNRALVFSQMTRMMDILEDYCILRGYKYCRIDGNTTYEDREDRIAAYNAPDSDIFIFLLSTRAGGLGINLQTADTVILYDSDWNPQADLQAQDRAHRIGQKKQVHVFRLVTDDTVEVKVIERAQQKLKLDAMVVQQGRLVDKDKKMNKDELLETLRFGADKIFKAKESSITDEDIDSILEVGKKRTEEMNQKLTDFEKGDMYNFRLDGGKKESNTQVFEGKDYSDKGMRDELASMPFYIDVGKRERKAVTDAYATSMVSSSSSSGAGGGDDRPKQLPRHLKLPRMDDWQFYDRTRLNELQALENKLLDEMVARREFPQEGITKLVLLPAELMEEKTRLLSEAFGNWTKVHFHNFVRACAKYGRTEYDKISKDVGRPVDEVRRYASKLFNSGTSVFSAAEMERIYKQIEKGEKRLEEIQRLTAATGTLINMFANPWEEMTFKVVGNVGRIFNSVEDRYLLCLTHLHGYGAWDLVRSSMRRCERFRFDYFIQSCSAEALGKRCEMLMKSAERELSEIDRRKQVLASAAAVSTAGSGAVAGSAGGGLARVSSSASLTKDGKTPPSASTNAPIVAGIHSSGYMSVPNAIQANQERVKELAKQIARETKQLSSARNALAKLAAEGAVPTAPAGKDKAGVAALLKEYAAVTGTASGAAGKPKAASSAASSAKEGGGSTFGVLPRPVPEVLVPQLARLIAEAGQGGAGKIVDTFVGLHPFISKRQIDMKIQEIAVKEKRAGDKYIMWHMKPGCEKYLEMEVITEVPQEDGAPSQAAASGAKKAAGAKTPGSAQGKRKREDGATPTTTPGKVKKPNGGASSASAAGTPPTAGAASPMETGTPAAAGASATTSGTPVPPQKYKRAFGFYVKATRHEAQAELKRNPPPGSGNTSETELLKAKLLESWAALDAGARAKFEKKEAEDKARYDRELSAYVAMGGDLSKLGNTAP